MRTNARGNIILNAMWLVCLSTFAGHGKIKIHYLWKSPHAEVMRVRMN